MHIPLAYPNWPLTLVLPGGPEIRTVIFCLFGSMDISFQMSLWNLQNERYRWRRTPYVTNKHHHHHHYQHHHHKHCTHKDFQHLLQNASCEIVENRMASASHASNEMNPTLTFLIMTVTVVTVTIKSTPDQPMHRALNSSHDMAYCK